ncbi:MAG: hypothetical protein FJ384_01550 [Verrucomicrobia bacterium]|nr:hypothetical protein [Verrucomicrobiota bacterium]
MRHAFTALALAAFVAGGHAQEASAVAPAPVPAATSDLSLRGLISWDAKNVFRGIERSDRDGLIQSLVTLDYSAPGLSGVSIYGSFFNADSLERTYAVGLRRDFSFGQIDVGHQRMTAATVRTIAADGVTQIDSNREFYAGVSWANLGMKPSTYVYYSTELKQYTVEIAGSKTFAGSNVGLTGCDIVFRAYAGICDASTSVHAAKNSYGYTGASLDVTRQIGRGPELGAGVNWAHNRDGQALTNGSVFWGRVYAKFIF